MRIIYIILLSLLSTFSAFSIKRDSRVREYLTPQKIVWTYGEDNIENKDILLLPGNGQSDLSNLRICKIRSDDKLMPSILIDFGKEIHGGVQIVTGMPKSNKPINVRICFGESVSEAMSNIDMENGATNDHAMRDFKVQLPWLGTSEVGNTGFRFVRLDLLDRNAELHLKEIRGISVFRDIPYKGSFRCSDDRLNQIWQTGAYTVHLNMQEYLWDGIKRDRLVWVGDLHPEIMTVNSVFGYNEVVPKSLDLIKDITPLPSWMNNISSYSIWWLLIHRDWYYYQGNLQYLKEQRDYIIGLLDLLMSKVDDKGIEKLDGNRFLDWPSNKHPQAIHAGLQSLMIMAMKAGEELCSVLGEKEMANKCKLMSKRMLRVSNAVLEEYLKSGKNVTDPGHKQGAALMSLAGIMDAKDANDNILSVDGANGFSTFYGYYMLQAMAKAGNYDGALNIIRNYWGAMLDLGATTFWEDFDIKWIPNASRIDELVPEGKEDIHGDFGAYCYKGFRHSLCHGWASGPTSWLTEHILGIKVLEPGCKALSIKPNLSDLSWVEGTFPTPYGIVRVSHKKNKNGEIKTEVNAPKEVRVFLK